MESTGQVNLAHHGIFERHSAMLLSPWNETSVDYTEIVVGEKLRTGIYEVKCNLFDDVVLVKFARFDWEIPYLESETTACQWIEGYDICPRSLGHLRRWPCDCILDRTHQGCQARWPSGPWEGIVSITSPRDPPWRYKPIQLSYLWFTGCFNRFWFGTEVWRPRCASERARTYTEFPRGFTTSRLGMAPLNSPCCPLSELLSQGSRSRYIPICIQMMCTVYKRFSPSVNIL